LSGINIGDFGKNTNETLYDLIAELNIEVDIPRYRISSIEPNLLSDDLIELIHHSKSFAHDGIPGAVIGEWSLDDTETISGCLFDSARSC